MYIKAIVLSVLLILSCSYEEEGNVLVLHDADFPQVLTDFPFILIQFYAPWCGHCQKLAPIFTQVADELKAQGSEVRLAKVDATIDKKSAEKYKVQGYPTIFFFHKGDPVDYKGQRTKQFMVNWLSKKTRDPLVPADQAIYQKLQTEDKVSIVYHGDASSQGAQIVNKLAISDDFNTYYIAQVGKQQGTVQIFRPFASVQTTQADQNLASWVARHERPTVVPFDDRTIGQLFSNKKAGACLFNVEGSNILLDAFSTAATQYLQSGKQLIFCEIAKDSEHLQGFSDYIKTKPAGMPVVLIEGRINSKFVLVKDPSELTSDDILNFLNSWNDGRATKLGMTDQVPSEDQLPGQL